MSERVKGKNFSMFSSSLCWDCRRAAGPMSNRCSWAIDFTPVDGWDAEKTLVYSTSDSGNPIYINSYHVYNCPLFLKDRNVKSETKN